MINNRQNRRRGRGGQRNQGNRQDNRQRGNATQLLDKYKGLARDAQMSGDRVQAEYYLQFADHYHRVVEDYQAEKQAKQDQRQQARQNDGDQKQDNDPQANEKPKRTRKKPEGGDVPKADAKSKRNGAQKPDKEDDAIPADVLPPAIGSDEADEAPKPRRRRKSSDDGEAASAA